MVSPGSRYYGHEYTALILGIGLGVLHMYMNYKRVGESQTHRRNNYFKYRTRECFNIGEEAEAVVGAPKQSPSP